MAVGFPLKTTYANGDVYSASDVNDTNGTINLLGSSVAYAAGKNKIINGDFGVWQRGTSFSSNGVGYSTDRFQTFCATTAGTLVVSRQTFTPGTAPVAGYEGKFFLRMTLPTTGTISEIDLWQPIEDVQTFAGQTVTFSFWAKSSGSNTMTPVITQNFGSGGSASVQTTGSTVALTTSWTRFTRTINIPSIAGKTIGTSSYLQFNLQQLTGFSNSATYDFWGWQVESGSTATAFQTATGTIQGELALCQRYYFKTTTGRQAVGFAQTTTKAIVLTFFPVEMRVAPSSLEQSGTAGDYLLVYLNTAQACSAVPTFQTGNKNNAETVFTVSSGLTAGIGVIPGSNGASSYLAWSAEL